MPEAQPTQARYVFLDVVDFTKERSTEAQTEIVSVLNQIVKDAVAEQKIPDGPGESVIYLPTGDGICVALVYVEARVESFYDVHLRLALSIIERVQAYNESTAVNDEVKFQVRIGVNEHPDDNIVTDINGGRNIAGAGINMAQRIMSHAEGNQIFVGQAVFETLKHRQKYIKPGLFHSHDVTIKHADVPTKIYQYVAEEHPGLNTTFENALKQEEAVRLFKSATACGLKKIYYSRDEVTGSVLQDIAAAQNRIWILGVGLLEKINLVELLPTLDQKINDLDLRILLLDALRSPALFRTFLEITPDAFREIVETNRSKKPPLEPYFQQQLYRTFHDRYSELKRRPAFRSAVRFYMHTPVCWLVIIDDSAYFQPYTFGRGRTTPQESPTLGPLMPVFKFQMHENISTATFSILEDHFNKLWTTSNTDLFHVGAQIVNRAKILQGIFEQRDDWFKHVYGVLHKTDGQDRRKYPRRTCESDPPPATNIEWEENQALQRVEAKIMDFSSEGILLELKSGKFPPADGIVTLRIQAVGKDTSVTEHLKKEFLEPCGGKFKVTRVGHENHPPFVALQAHLT
ncbi:MAG TPA: adenylate/guanylate cyclase domain-containing protein [Pyrinomonadaceae bacterium]|jgi:class 3 adenylate cyclase